MNTESNDNLSQSENRERRHELHLAYTGGWIGGAILIVLESLCRQRESLSLITAVALDSNVVWQGACD